MIALAVSLLIVLPLAVAAVWMSRRSRGDQSRPEFVALRDARVVVVSATSVPAPTGVLANDALRQWCRVEAVVTPRAQGGRPAEWVPGVLQVVEVATADRCVISGISCFDGKSWTPAGSVPRQGPQSLRIQFAADERGAFRFRYAGEDFGTFAIDPLHGVVPAS